MPQPAFAGNGSNHLLLVSAFMPLVLVAAAPVAGAAFTADFAECVLF
jgi:hypothetical protein